MGHRAEKLRRATYADLAALPPGKVAELIRGTLHVMPRPAPRHAHTSSALGAKLANPFGFGEGGPGAWLVDPIARTLEAYTLGADRRWSAPEVHRDTERVRLPPFEAVELDLSALWA